VWINLSI